MNYTYQIRSDIILDEDKKKHTVYGIEAVTADNVILESVADIFLNEQRAKKFADLCNTQNLSLIHLQDVIEDELT